VDGDIEVIEVEAHPPERGQRQLILASGCCTCCCCCSCCLHSVGATVGVAVAARRALEADEVLHGGASTSPLQPPAVVIGFGVVAGVVSAATLALGGDIEVAALVLAVAFPLVLGAALVLVVPVAALAGSRGLSVWSKLLGGVVLGSIGGVALMVMLGVALSVMAMALR
jgi:hypothetical protein